MKAQTCPFGMIMTSCLGKMLDKAKNQGKPRKYLRNINVRWFGFDLSDVQEMRIADDEVERYSIRKGDLVVCEGGEPGRCAIWCDGETVCFQKALHRIRFNTASDPRFYMYYLWMLAKSGMLSAYYTGTGIKHLTGESLKKLPVPVPPLSEQKRIVARIEELFSELDNGVETLKKTKQQLAVYRQAVLKAAFEGRLTRTYRETKGFEKWEMVPITAVIAKNKNALKAGPFGSALKKDCYVPSGYKVYGQEQVIAGDETIGNYYINKKKYEELSSCAVAPEDVLISLVGTVGKVLVLSDACLPGIINPRLIKVTLDATKMLPLFFKYYFESAYLKSLYKEKAHGATMDVLNMGMIKELPFPFCNVKEQRQVIAEIESRLSVCDSIEKTVDAALQQAESMRQSILKKAFEGKL